MTVKQKLFFIVILMLVILVYNNSIFCQDIHNAVQNRDMNTVKILLEENPNLINSKDNENNSPLHYAAILDIPDIAEFLLKKGADINLRGSFGRTPLFFAASFGSYNTCLVLIEKGSDLNIKNIEGRRPLYYAVYWKRREIVEKLLSSGAYVDIKGDYGRSLFHTAAIGGFKELVDLMIKKGVDLYTKNDNEGNLLHSISYGGITELIDTIIKKGLDVNEKDRYGLTPLHIASSSGNIKVVESLIVNGAEINIKSINGKNAYHFAVENEHKNIIKILVENKIDTGPGKFPELKGDYLGMDKPNDTPLLFAPGIISTSRNEHGVPVFHPNLKEVYWSMFAKDSEVIMYMKEENGFWSAPQIMSFSGQYNDGNPFLSIDGNKLYFNSNRPLEKDGKAEDYDIWFIERIGNGWDKPRNLGPPVNTENWDCWGSAAKNGTLYYTYESDIYRSGFVNGQYKKPEKLGGSISTEYLERGTLISPDESYLIFSSVRPGGVGSGDLYIVFKKPDGSWSDAVNMGNKINSPKLEMVCSISPDGKYLFIRTFRNGNADIYWVSAKIIEELKPKELK